MATILRNLPFYDKFTTIHVRQRAYRIFPYQIVLRVSLSRARDQILDPRTPRFPAVVDPAFTDNFLIHEQQLQEFAGLQPVHLPRWPDDLRAPGRRIPLHEANLWLHRNRLGERDSFADTPPFLLELDRGIGVSRGPDPFPRLPLLGARALRRVRAQLAVDYAGRPCRRSARDTGRAWPRHRHRVISFSFFALNPAVALGSAYYPRRAGRFIALEGTTGIP